MFRGVELCLSFSWLLHATYCSSQKASHSLQTALRGACSTLRSFAPWLMYRSIICALGIPATIAAQWVPPKHPRTRPGMSLGPG